MNMKSALVALLVSIFMAPAYSAECVNMTWKVPGEYLAFDTVMEAAEGESKFSMNFESLLGEEEARSKAAEAFENFEFPKSSSMTAILTPAANDHLNIKVVMGKAKFDSAPDSEQAAHMRKFMEAMSGTVQLRGVINARGEITSFYLPQRQKNLLSIFFELPSKCVKIGDEWSLDLNLLEMDQNFVPESTSRYNTVRLHAIENRGGATIAVLDYVILESISGGFHVPMQDKVIPTSMNMGFTGRGYFNVTEGRWEKLTGTLGMDSTGPMNANTTQFMALRPATHVTEAVLNAK